MKEIIGILPAGGLGKRMQPFKLWKELIPVGYKKYLLDNENKEIPKVISEYTIENMVQAGVKKVLFIINDQKTELLRFFGQGNSYETSIAYVCQQLDFKYFGMPIAIDSCYEWIKKKIVLMGMPDTISRPNDCFLRTLLIHREKKADLTLGIFPSKHPERLGQVILDQKNNRVIYIHDKAKEIKSNKVWGIAVWNECFTEFLHSEVQSYLSDKENCGGELVLSDIFNLAIKKGLSVYGLYFSNGIYYDLGDINDFLDIKYEVEKYLNNDLKNFSYV